MHTVIFSGMTLSCINTNYLLVTCHIALQISCSILYGRTQANNNSRLIPDFLMEAMMAFVMFVVMQKIKINTTFLCMFLIPYIERREEGSYMHIIHPPPGKGISMQKK